MLSKTPIEYELSNQFQAITVVHAMDGHAHRVQSRRRVLRAFAYTIVAGGGMLSLLAPVGTLQPAATIERALGEQALAFIASLQTSGERQITGPVARLQRRFRLGYRTALALAIHIEHAGAWSLSHNDTGERIATLCPTLA